MSNNRNRNRKRSGNPAVRAEAERETKAIDFDAVRAKRRRVLRDIPPVKIGGKDYTLAPTLPLAVTEFFAEDSRAEGGNVVARLGQMQHLLSLLFGEDQWAEICKVIDITEVAPLFNTVFDAYGEAVGESGPSGQS